MRVALSSNCFATKLTRRGWWCGGVEQPRKNCPGSPRDAWGRPGCDLSVWSVVVTVDGAGLGWSLSALVSRPGLGGGLMR
jgi:hypothetical protein